MTNNLLSRLDSLDLAIHEALILRTIIHRSINGIADIQTAQRKKKASSIINEARHQRGLFIILISRLPHSFYNR